MTIKFKRRIKKLFNYFGVEISSYRQPEFYLSYNKTLEWIFDKLPLQEFVIFDLGANIGAETMNYKVLFPTSKLYCFEPFLETFEKLKINTQELKDVFTYQLAIADTIGKRNFHVNINSDVNSLYNRPQSGRKYYPTDGRNTGIAEVHTDTIDHFLEMKKIQRVNILKIDVEGAEMEVLRGSADSLSKSAIDILVLEAGFVRRFESESLFDQLLQFLQGYGYTLYNIFEIVHDRSNGQLKRVNVLMVSERIRREIIEVN